MTLGDTDTAPSRENRVFLVGPAVFWSCSPADPKGTAELNRLYSIGDIQTSGEISFAPTEGLVAAGAMTNELFFER